MNLARSLAALALVAATAPSCRTESPDVTACTVDGDCSAPRFCDRNLCVRVVPTVTSPADGTVTRCEPPPALDGVATGDVPADAVDFLVNGRPHPPGPLACQGEGTYEIVPRARVGTRLVTGPAHHVRVDRTPPRLTWSVPPGATLLPSSTATAIVGTLDEPVSVDDVGGFVATVDGAPAGPVTLAAGGRSFTLPLPRPMSGIESVSVRVPVLVDAAGNELVPPAGGHVWTRPALFLALDVPLRPPLWPFLHGVVPFEIQSLGTELTGARLRLDDGTAVRELPIAGPPWVLFLDTATLPDGNYAASAVGLVGPATFAGQGVQVSIDNTPPRSVLQLPGTLPGHEEDLSVRDPITLSFDEPVFRSSLSPGSVRALTDLGGAVPVQLEMDPADLVQSVTIRLVPPPRPPATVTLQFDGRAMDQGGLVQVEPTRGRAVLPLWLLRVERAPASGGALLPGRGDAFAELVPGAPSRAWAGSVHFPQLLGSPDGLPAADPVVAQGVSAVWAAHREQSPSGRWSVVAALHGFGWGRLPSPMRDASRSGGAPALAVVAGAADAPELAWTEADAAGGPRLHLSRFDGPGWTAIGGDLGLGAAASPSVASLPAEGAVLAWLETPAGGPATVHVRRVAAGAPGPAEGPLNADPAASASPPRIAAGADGIPVLVWSEGSGAVSRVEVRRVEGGAWRTAGYFPGARDPSVVVDGAGRAVVAWVDAATGEPRAARLLEPGVWAQLGSASARGVRPGTRPEVQLDGHGRPEVGFSDASGVLRRLALNE